MTGMWISGGAYDAWVTFLDRWSAGETIPMDALPALRPQDYPADGWVRISDRLLAAISARLQRWADSLTRAIGAARDEFAAGAALAQARDGVYAVRALAAHPGLPPELREKVQELVEHQVRTAQESLERQVDQLRRQGVPAQQVEARLRTLRDNRLSAAAGTAAAGTASGGTAGGRPSAGWAVDLTAPPRRRVIVDRPTAPSHATERPG